MFQTATPFREASTAVGWKPEPILFSLPNPPMCETAHDVRVSTIAATPSAEGMFLQSSFNRVNSSLIRQCFSAIRPVVGNPGTFLLSAIHKVTPSDGCDFGIDSKIDECASSNFGTSHNRAEDL